MQRYGQCNASCVETASPARGLPLTRLRSTFPPTLGSQQSSTSPCALPALLILAWIRGGKAARGAARHERMGDAELARGAQPRQDPRITAVGERRVWVGLNDTS